MHNKMKFRLNKYTANFIIKYAVLLYLIRAILKVISYFVTFNMVKVGACILVALLVISLLAYKIITNTDEFKQLNFSQDVISSLSLHMKYIDKFNTYVNNEVDFFKKQDMYTFSSKNNRYSIEELYKKELPIMKEGNEFWISANALCLSFKTNNPRHPEFQKLNSFISLEENLYKHREEVLKNIRNLFIDKNRCYELKNGLNSNNYISQNISIIEQAIRLNNLIYSMEDYIPHKKMLTTLFDKWVLLIANYIVDTNDCLNKEFINSFQDISSMVTKEINEVKIKQDKLDKEEYSKMKNIWDKESVEYAKLIKSISQDLK